MTNKRIVIFDVDNTLANSDHRDHLFKQTPKDWNKISEESLKDLPHDEIKYLNHLISDDTDNIILIVTARREDDRNNTLLWLDKNEIYYHDVYMRDIGDYRPDDQVKQDILYKIIEKYKMKPYMVFEDRCSVVEMWRRNGIKCLQVDKFEE